MRREQDGFAGQMMVEGVVHETEATGAADRLNRLDSLGFPAERADFKAERFNHAGQPVIFQHRLQVGQRADQDGPACDRVHALIVVARDQADRLGPGGDSNLHQGQRFGSFGIGPVVEHLDLGQRQDAQAARPGSIADRFRGKTVEQRLRQVIAEFHADTAQRVGGIEKCQSAKAWHGHVVQRKGSHWSPRSRSPRFHVPGHYGIIILFFVPYNRIVPNTSKTIIPALPDRQTDSGR